MSDEVRFQRGGARRPIPEVRDTLMQWASGLPTTDRRIYSGWMIEAGKDSELDEAMDAAQFNRVTIKHSGGKIVTHWAIEVAKLFVVCDGIQTITEMNHSIERLGIAFGWCQNNGRNQTVLRLRCYLYELLLVGYTQPIMISMRGTVTGDLLAALMSHYAAMDAINQLRQEQGKPHIDLPFYSLACPIGPGQETTRTNGQQGREIIPPAYALDQPIDRDTLKRLYIKQAWVPIIEQEVQTTIEWSVRESKRIVTEITQVNESDGYEDTPHEESVQPRYRQFARHYTGENANGNTIITQQFKPRCDGIRCPDPRDHDN
jgi:hypothetical protein